MEVVICGAGIAGLTLAWRLQRLGHHVLVVECSGDLRDSGYMIDFFGPGFDACERLGLLADLAAIHYPVANLVFVDRRGRTRVSLPYPVLRQRWFDGRHFNFMRGDLERLLYRLLKPPIVRFGVTVDAFDQQDDEVHVRLSDGASMRCDLLVGADGVHSRIRELAFGADSQFVRSLGCRAVAFVSTETSPRLLGDDFVTVTVPQRQVSVYPVRDGLATFFLHRIATAEPRSPNACEELQRHYADLEWIVPLLIGASERATAAYVGDVEQVVMTEWFRGQVVLLGDACQCVSPLAGQGASLAMFAATVLAEELARATDIAVALAGYQARVQPLAAQRQDAGRRLAGWFLPDTSLRLKFRDMALRASLLPVFAPFVRRQLAA